MAIRKKSKHPSPRGKHRKHARLKPSKLARIGTSRKRRLAPADPGDPRDAALKLMEEGLSQREAAKSVGISTRRLARHRRHNTRSRFKKGRWFIFDLRPKTMYVAANGRVAEAALSPRAASVVGKHWNAVNAFLDTNDRSHLRAFDGRKVRDAAGRYYVLETDPNALRRLDSIGDLGFIQIYANAAQPS